MLLQNLVVALFPHILLPLSLNFSIILTFGWDFFVGFDDVDHLLPNLIKFVDEFRIPTPKLVPFFLCAYCLELLFDYVNFLDDNFEFLHEKLEPSIYLIEFLLPNSCPLSFHIFHFIFVLTFIAFSFKYWLLVLLWVLHLLLISHKLSRLLRNH